MRIPRLLCLCLLSLGMTVQGNAQSVDINRTNKTISVTITETIRVQPDLAIVAFGYRNYAKTKDATYEENVRVANRITKALLDAGIPKESIETESVRLNNAAPEWSSEAPKGEKFGAKQSWKVRVAVPDAQKVVDLVTSVGANEIEDVEWTVADPVALEAKAGSTALTKARELARRMAQDLGVRIGELLFVSNTRPLEPEIRVAAMYAMAVGPAAAKLPPPKLTLFSKQVEREATVHAVFALE